MCTAFSGTFTIFDSGRDYEEINHQLVIETETLNGPGFFANLQQFPHALNMSGDTLRCLLRKSLTWSSKHARWLLPVEALGVHLCPVRQSDMEGTSVNWPFGKHETISTCGADCQSLAGNGMVLPVIGAVLLAVGASLESVHGKENP